MPERPFVRRLPAVARRPVARPRRVHPVWAYAHVPHGYRGDATEALLDQIERFAPGLRERILATAVRSTGEIERDNANYVGGDIITGANTPRADRDPPAAGARPLRDRIPGVFICSAATPPGAGAHGMNGYNAAEVGAAEPRTRHELERRADPALSPRAPRSRAGGARRVSPAQARAALRRAAARGRRLATWPAGAPAQRARPRSERPPARARAPGRAGALRPARAAAAADGRDGAGRAPRGRPAPPCSPTPRRRRWSCSRTRATSATWAPACASPPPPTPPACSAPAATTPGIPTRCAAPPGCTTRCRSPRLARRPARPLDGACDRPLLAIDPDGEPLEPAELPAARGARVRHRALRALRTSSPPAPTRASAIPMRAGVSSLNLATSVAAVLFAWRLSARPPRR